MKRAHKIILASLTIPIAGLAGANIAVYNDNQHDRIEEDDPRWNCSTMGNKICGTITHPDGTCEIWDGDEYELLGERDCSAERTAHNIGFQLGRALRDDPGALNAFIEQCEGVRNDPFCQAVFELQDRRITK